MQHREKLLLQPAQRSVGRPRVNFVRGPTLVIAVWPSISTADRRCLITALACASTGCTAITAAAAVFVTEVTAALASPAPVNEAFAEPLAALTRIAEGVGDGLLHFKRKAREGRDEPPRISPVEASREVIAAAKRIRRRPIDRGNSANALPEP